MKKEVVLVVLKAIETPYRGYRFRSRLEARWAVFFDALSVPWEYEKEGFDLGDGVLYLPDFWLPVQGYWFEVKGTRPSRSEIEKATRLAVESRHEVVVAIGVPTPLRWGNRREPGSATERAILEGNLYHANPYGDWDGELAWGACPNCGSVTIGTWGYCAADDLTVCRTRKIDEINGGNAPRIIAACNAARSARFEHGESG
jgi:hypothetical protein